MSGSDSGSGLVSRRLAAASVSRYGGRKTPRSVMIAVMYWLGVTSKAGLRTFAPSGASWCLPTCVTSRGLRSSMGMPDAVGGGQVDGGPRRRHVEGDAVLPRQHGHRVGADLVGGVAVGGDAVGADDDQSRCRPRA